MRLKLAIGEKVIASVPLDVKKASCRDYIQAKKRLLNSVYFDAIALQGKPPVYYIEVASKMNRVEAKG